MCYYATTDYVCGDWKWGNMMLRCPRQHRIGETCGAKLVHHESVTKSSQVCKVCEEISTKQRRLSKTHDNILRWSKEPDKFSASLDKARRESRELEEKVRELQLRRPSVSTKINGAAPPTSNGRSASTAAATATTLPPVTSMSTSATAGYEYTSTPAVRRQQDASPYNVPRNGIMPVVGGAPAQVSGQYARIPAAGYASRNTTAVSASPANVTASRPSGGYTVSYARR